MLLSAFRLRRDVNTERSSFGFSRSSLSKLGKVTPTSPALGWAIETIEPAVTIKTNIVKMIELYHRKIGSVVVERLSWMSGSLLYPYKARFIRIDRNDTTGDMDLLFPNNMTRIHKALSGRSISFESPIKYHINSTAPPWHNNHSHEELHYFNKKYDGWLSNFAYAHDAWTDTEQFINMFDNGNVASSEERFEQFMVPKPPIKDPFTLNANLPINPRNLSFDRPTIIPFDVSPPIDLVVHHPEKTVYSPMGCYAVVEDLEQISLQYSDLNLEYILSNTAFVSCKINYAVSRYRDPSFNHSDINRECRWVISNAIQIIYGYFPNTKLLGDVRASLVMTYGDEALIEFFNYDTNQHLGSIHLDLAMMALCGLNIAVNTDPF